MILSTFVLTLFLKTKNIFGLRKIFVEVKCDAQNEFDSFPKYNNDVHKFQFSVYF